MKDWPTIQEENIKRRRTLIRDNFYAPADSVLRAIMVHGTNVREPNEGVDFSSIEEIMEYWYKVDEMRVSFILNGMRSSVWFVHQNTHRKPCIEDIVDYSMNLDEPGNESVLCPLFKPDNYNGVYQ